VLAACPRGFNLLRLTLEIEDLILEVVPRYAVLLHFLQNQPPFLPRMASRFRLRRTSQADDLTRPPALKTNRHYTYITLTSQARGFFRHGWTSASSVEPGADEHR
jgi:hypothetical protein